MSDLSKRRDFCPSSFHNMHRKQQDHNDKYEKDNRRYFPGPFPTANILFSKENKQANTNKGFHHLYLVCHSSFMAKVSSSDRLHFARQQFPLCNLLMLPHDKSQDATNCRITASLATLRTPATFYLFVL